MLQKAVKVWECLLKRPSRLALIKYRVAASTEHRGMLRAIAPDVVLDVGANRGQFALAVLNECPCAEVISFEPLPIPAKIYRRVMNGKANVFLHEIAVTKEAQQVKMNVSNRDDSSSLLPISPLQNLIFPNTFAVSSQEVQCMPLSAVIDRAKLFGIVMLKIDVQGSELGVIEGSIDLLDRIGFIYVECSFRELYLGQVLAHDVISVLVDLGFRLSEIYNLTHDSEGRAVQADFLFQRWN
jgi:FkbM family methyltransferase